MRAGVAVTFVMFTPTLLITLATKVVRHRSKSSFGLFSRP